MTSCKSLAPEVDITSKPKLLILEDDELFGESLSEFLELEGFGVDLAKNLESASNLSFYRDYELYIFDINLPDGSGIEFLESLKNSGDETPTIYLTSYKDRETLLKGFKSGCDDYLKKPCDLDELLARVHALLRRSGKISDRKFLGSYSLECSSRTLTKDGIKETLPNKLFLLAELFADSQDGIVTQELIADRLWGAGEEPSFGAIRVYINKLNRVIKPDRIKNIRGLGYRFEVS